MILLQLLYHTRDVTHSTSLGSRPSHAEEGLVPRLTLYMHGFTVAGAFLTKF